MAVAQRGPFEGPLDLATYKDEYRAGLQRIIDAKIAGEEIVAPAVETPPRVVELMDALKKSLNAVTAAKKKPAKAAVTQPAQKRTRVGMPDRRNQSFLAMQAVLGKSTVLEQ